MAIKSKKRELTIVIRAKDSFSATFSKASNLAKSTASVITKSFKAASVAITGTATAFIAVNLSITAFVNSVAVADDKVGKLALRIGATTDALSEYGHVAELSGITAQTMATAWQRQMRRISEAVSGSGSAKEALEELNLSALDLSKLAPEDQFELIADAMLDVSNQGDKMRIAMQIWDTEGVSLLQTMEGGAAGLREMREEARLLGLSLSGEEAKAAADFNDAMLRLTATFGGLKRQIGQELMPTLTAGFISLKSNIVDLLPTIKKTIIAGVKIFQNLPEVAELAGQAISDAFKRTLTDPVAFTALIDNFEIVAKSIISASVKIGATTVKVFARVASIIWAPLFEAFKTVRDNIEAVFSNMIKQLKLKMIRAAIAIVQVLPEKFRPSLKLLSEMYVSVLRQADKGTRDFSEGWKNAGKTIIKEFSGIGEEFTELGKEFKAQFIIIKAVLGNAANSPEMVNFLSKVEGIINRIDTVKGKVKGLSGDQDSGERFAPVPELDLEFPIRPKITFAPELDMENELITFFDGLNEIAITAAKQEREQVLLEFKPRILLSPELELENELSTFFEGLAADELERDEFKRDLALSFFDFESDLTMKRMDLQRQAAALDIELSDEVALSVVHNSFLKSSAERAARAISRAANKAMEDQMLSLVETGKFSAQEFAKVVAQQAKAELIGFAARAAVQAIFYTGLGFAALAGFQGPSAANYFTAAGNMAIVSGVALAGAKAVHQVVGSSSTGNPTGVDPTTQTSPGTDAPISDPVGTQQGTIINIEINNPIGSEDWDKIAREEIIPAINRGGADNITIDSTVIRAV